MKKTSRRRLLLVKKSIKQPMKSVAAACTARPQRYFFREIPFPGRNNRFFSFISCAQMAWLKNERGGCGGGRFPPSTSLSKTLLTAESLPKEAKIMG
ncbi:MAG: hypothetical protein IKU34_02360 [Clostridia bacterium]|nr:hypothetical protein [Clostridia bacterium]